MPCDLSALSEADKKDFEERLQIYGLDAASLHQEELVVSRDSNILLSMSQASFIKPRILQTQDLGIVKRWVGVDDKVFQNSERDTSVCIPLPPRENQATQAGTAQETRGTAKVSGLNVRTTATFGSFDTSKMASRHLDNLQLAARNYVRGNSKTTASAYKNLIEAHFKIFQIPIWAFLKVIVKSGSVLAFGPGSNVLTAHTLEIEEGGIVRSFGHLTVNCTIVRKKNFTFTSAAVLSGVELVRA